ncbi:MAG: histidine phosphatase family protein [Deltaproteobacteria bacterium]|nr:histidine phosphatase family protein [Deltaproteobacteria bacterium]
MHVTLVRHGRAAPELAPLGDAGRVLTVDGRAQVRETGEALARLGASPSEIWSSPLVRAVQTAELLAAATGYTGEIRVQSELLPYGSAGALLDAMRLLSTETELLLAGHEPFMSHLATVLGGERVSGFSTGAAYRYVLPTVEPGAGRLLWRRP